MLSKSFCFLLDSVCSLNVKYSKIILNKFKTGDTNPPTVSPMFPVVVKSIPVQSLVNKIGDENEKIIEIIKTHSMFLFKKSNIFIINFYFFAILRKYYR